MFDILVKNLSLWVILLLILGGCKKNPKHAIFTRPPFLFCHAPSLVEVENGDLLCAFFAGEEEGKKGCGIWTCRMTANTWTAPVCVALDEEQMPCWNPVLVVLPGEVLLFYKVGRSPHAWSGVLKRSKDDGKTWSEEEPLPAGIYGTVKGKPLLMQDGNLLCGSSVESYRRWGAYVEWTYDRGQTWNRSAPINLVENYYGMIQPVLASVGEEELLLLARTNLGYIARSRSYDSGKSWEAAVATSLPNPNAAIDLASLQDGRLLLVYNHSTQGRYPLVAATSLDKGNSWNEVFVIEKGKGDFAYPSIVQRRNGDVWVAYTWNRKSIVAVNLGTIP